MKKYKILSSEFGISIVEVMVAAALLGGLSLGVMRLMENSNKAAKTIETKDEISLLTNQINDVLKNPNNCEATFGSKKQGDSIFMVNQVLGGVPVPKFTVSNAQGPNVQIESMVLKNVDHNGSNGSTAIATLEVTFKKPEKTTYGGRSIKKEISLNANLCKKNYIENTDRNALLASCTGANKLLLTGVNSWSGTNWAICQDCTDAVTAGVINSCASTGSNGGVDLADMNSNICLQLGGEYDPSKSGCSFNGQSFTDLIKLIMRDIKDLQVWQTEVNKVVNNMPSGFVDATAPNCAYGAKYSMAVENGKIKLKCENPGVCTGCAIWGEWTHSETGYTCLYKCEWEAMFNDSIRRTCSYTRSCIIKSPEGCTSGSVPNESSGSLVYSENLGGRRYPNTLMGRNMAKSGSCPSPSTFGLK